MPSSEVCKDAAGAWSLVNPQPLIWMAIQSHCLNQSFQECCASAHLSTALYLEWEGGGGQVFVTLYLRPD